MKRFTTSFTLVLATLTSTAFGQVKETAAFLSLNEGGNPQGYVQGANAQGIIFSSAQGRPGQLLPYAKIKGEGLDKLIRFEERVEALGEPRALFAAGDYAAAATAFGDVARNYAIILSVPQSFAAEALFYQMESLKRSGNYAALAQIMEAPVSKVVETNLGERYQKLHEFQKLWAKLGANDMDGLKAAIATYEEPVVGDAKLLSTPNFKKRPPAELAQLAYLRAKVYDAADESAKALEDYYRAFTLASGNDDLMAKLAMGAAMVSHKKDPRFSPDNARLVSQLQGLAYLYSKRFGKDTMPEEFQEFAVRPPMVRLAPAAEAAPAAEEGAAPAPEEKADAPADEAKKE
ncbi:MAG: hypothetical protein P1U86_09050 [Verrucomicrobiales bacterium]|nr:hypothetical protein [Verrucomicrobiales bacterium]